MVTETEHCSRKWQFRPKETFFELFLPKFRFTSTHPLDGTHEIFQKYSDIAVWLHGSTNGAEDVGHVTEDCNDSNANNVVRFLLLALNAAT